MKKSFRRHVARAMAAVMVMATMFGAFALKGATSEAAQLPGSSYLDLGVKYNGSRTVDVTDGIATIQYLNVNNSAFESGDVFYISTKLSGASEFKQAAIQSNMNNWDWNAAPKKWVNAGLTDGTKVSGIMKATQAGTGIVFKLQLDNAVDTLSESATVTLSDLFIVKIKDADTTATALPSTKQISFGTPYSGTVAAEKNSSGAYEMQYFNVNDSAYSADDTYVIYSEMSDVSMFNQAAAQSSVNNWSWDEAIKVWANDGLADPYEFAGDMTASASGANLSFKLRTDTLKEGATDPGNSMDVDLTNLVIVKVSPEGSVPLPTGLGIGLDVNYSGTTTAEQDGTHWQVQYFNVDNSAFEVGDKFRVSFEISGASNFKQIAVQSNADSWAWDSAPKMWKNAGVENGTKFKGIITATAAQTSGLAFKLWLDNQVDDTVTGNVDVTLANLKVERVDTFPNLSTLYASKFDIGAAISYNSLQDTDIVNIAKNSYSTLTPENEMKPDALLDKAACQAAADGNPVISTGGLDAIFEFAEANNMEVRGHALVYGAQTPDWFFRTGYTDDGAYVNSATMKLRMENYIKAVLQYIQSNYPDTMTSVDVVNEAYSNDGSLVSNKWVDIIGEDYVALAFKYAKLYAANTAKLYYNDYNLEMTAKQGAVEDLVIAISDVGGRIDGIGMQLHATLSYPSTTSLGTAIDFFADDLEKDVQITELEVQLDEGESGYDQATRYTALFNVLLQKQVNNVTFWGISDAFSWQAAKTPLLFDDEFAPKQAFYAIADLMNS